MTRTLAARVAALVALVVLLAAADARAADLRKLEAEFKAAVDRVETATVIVVPSDPGQGRFVPRLSGVLVSKTGLVLTHDEAGASVLPVRGQKPDVKHSDDVDVRVPDMKKGTFRNYKARVVKRFPDCKSALVQVTDPPVGTGFPSYLVPATSAELRTGSFLFAMGNSGASSEETLPSLMAGVVAALPRRAGAVPATPSGTYSAAGADGPYEMIYTTAGINSGMEGGPVVDVRGRLVGTVVGWVDAVREATSPYQFLGRVMPVDRLRAAYAGVAEAEKAFAAPAQRALDADDATALETVFAHVAETSRGSVLSLEVQRKAPVSSATIGRDGKPTELPRYRGPVSAFAVSADGLVVTALYDITNLVTLRHPQLAAVLPPETTTKAGIDAVEGATVHLPGGGAFPAKLLAVHEGLGIAVFRAELPQGTTLSVAEPSPPDLLAEGRFVVALGNPYGKDRLPEPLVTVGILSKRHADDAPDAWRGHWQTDARATDGNCGGAVVDLRGRLVGMLSLWDPAAHGRASGIGFVLPWADIAAALPSLAQGKSWRRPFLGVAWDLEAEGVVRIKSVVPGSAAAASGILAGDEILAIDGEAVTSVADCGRLLVRRVAGDRIKLRIHRGSDVLDVEATLGARD